jgi:hypothetical protein
MRRENMLTEKKRVMLTLNTANYARLHASLKALGIPKGAVSAIVDESIEQHLIPLLEEMYRCKQEGKQISFANVMTHVDRSVDELRREFK